MPHHSGLHHARTADHFQISNFRQISQNLILYAIGEKGILFVIAQVIKWENRDAFFSRAAGAVTGVMTGVATGMGDEELLLANGAERRDNKYPPQQVRPRL